MQEIALYCIRSMDYMPALVTTLAYDPSDSDHNIGMFLVKVCWEQPMKAVKAVYKASQVCNELDKIRLLKFLFEIVAPTLRKFDDVFALLKDMAKAILLNSNGDDFEIAMKFLKEETEIPNSVMGQHELVFLALKRARIVKKLNLREDEKLASDRIIICVKSIIHFFDNNVSSEPLVNYFCLEILPQWDIIGEKSGAYHQYEYLKILAELCLRCDTMKPPKASLRNVILLLMKFMPLPSKDFDKIISDEDFSNVECLLYVFHYLVAQCPGIEFDQNFFQEFRTRLKFFLQNMRIRRDADKLKCSPLNRNSHEMDLKRLVLINVFGMIKYLLLIPPTYDYSNITLSFMKQTDGEGPRKRFMDEVNDEMNTKRPRRPISTD